MWKSEGFTRFQNSQKYWLWHSYIGKDHTLSSLSHFHNSIVQRRSLFFFYLFHLLSLLRRALFCAFQKTSFLFLCFYNSIYSFIWYLFCNLFYFIAERNHFYRLRRKTSMSAKKSKTFFKTLTAILVLLLFFGGYYIYSSGIFGASVTENISEHSITDEERLIEYEESSPGFLEESPLSVFSSPAGSSASISTVSV